MKQRVIQLISELPQIEEKLSDPVVLSDQKEFKKLSQKHSYLSELKELWEKFEKVQQSQADNKILLKDEAADDDLIQMLQDDIEKNEKQIEELEGQIHQLLVPPDPLDHSNTIMELRAGTGGDEAAIFVGDCVRMYRLYADSMGWKYELLSCSESDAGGFKEYIMVLSGKNVHRYLQYEGGTHRVQRVPTTESQGRVHTSAITIAIMSEPEEAEIDVKECDLRVDTYRASGAGGQHVNTTDSAVRITHIPTGVVAYCSQEKSQHKNRDKALRLLKAKILEHEEEKKAKERSEKRGAQVGSGDRSERIRTYNFPQNRLTDHRINLTLYSLDSIMNGHMEDVSNALISHFYQKKLQNS